MELIPIVTRQREEMVEITAAVSRIVESRGMTEGIAVLQSLHTTGSLTINENADPDVKHDMLKRMSELVPEAESYFRHAEGNSDSHVKTSMFGPSLTIIVTGGRLLLGQWQGIYFCEWDGPRERKVAVQLISE